MLEQAIADAKALKEAALKTAETTILEKYSKDIKSAVDQMLQEEEDLFGDLESEEGLGLEAEDDAGLGADAEAEDQVVADIPTAFGPEAGAQEIVELDLDDIIAIEKEEPSEPVDREELADSVGVPELEGEGEMPANRDDENEIEINEEELVNVFKEMLTVDIPSKEVDEAKHKDELEEEENEPEHPLSFNDGQDEADRKIEELNTVVQGLTENLEQQKEINNNLKEVLLQAKNKLQEVNLSNARLYYTNCVLGDSSLNERQKKSFAETISDIQTVNEAKVVYETLLKTVAAKTIKSGPESLSEAVAKTSSTIIGSHKREQAFEKDPTKSRWAKLAGLRG